MTFTATNLTDSEYFKLNETLSVDRIEKLLDTTDNLARKLQDIDAKISEASAQFQDESLMETIKARMIAMKSNLRGENRLTMEKIISDFDADILSTIRDAEYGISELNDAQKTIREIQV